MKSNPDHKQVILYAGDNGENEFWESEHDNVLIFKNREANLWYAMINGKFQFETDGVFTRAKSAEGLAKKVGDAIGMKIILSDRKRWTGPSPMKLVSIKKKRRNRTVSV